MTFAMLDCSGPDAETVTLSESAQRGEEVFETHCAVCHGMSEAGQGPKLSGLIGREAGSLRFAYSEAFQEADFVWTEERLLAFLEHPRETVPGNQMAFFGLEDAQMRDDLVNYLAEF